MSAAPNAAPTGCPKTTLPKAAKSITAATADGRRTIPDAAYQRLSAADKERAPAMYQESSSLSAVARIFGVSVQAVRQWIKKGGARSRMRRRGAKRTAGVAGAHPAAVAAFDEMWTYRQARRRGNRQDVWVWTAVVEEGNGSQWADFEVGHRSEATFLRLYERLPEAELYCMDSYRVYGCLPAGRHQVEKGGAVNWNEGLHSWC